MRRLAVAIIPISVACSAFAAVGIEDATTWVQEQLKKTVHSEVPSDFYFAWETETRAAISESEILELSKATEAKSGHSKNNKISQLKNLAAKPILRSAKLWRSDPNLWRLSEDQSGGGMADIPADSARNRSEMWSAGKTGLNVMSAGKPTLKGWDPSAALEMSLTAELGYFFGGFDDLRVRGATLRKITPLEDGLTWTAIFQSGPLEWVEEIHWNTLLDTFVVQSSIQRRVDRDEVLCKWNISDYARFDANTTIASTVTIENPQAHMNSMSRLIAWSPVSRDKVESLAVTPSSGTQDEVRGNKTYVSLLDMRGGKRIYSRTIAGKGTQKIDLSDTSLNRGIVWWQMLCWGLVVLTISFVILFCRFEKERKTVGRAS